MMTTSLDEKWTDPVHAKIAERAVALHECANSISARLRTQNELISRLRAELDEIRSIAKLPAPPVKAREVVFDPPVGAEPFAVDAPFAAPPVAAAPVAEAPVAEPLAAEAPAVDPFFAKAPVDFPPVAQAPVAVPPVAEAPVAEAPAAEPPAAEAPIVEPLVADEPAAEPPAPEPTLTIPPYVPPPPVVAVGGSVPQSRHSAALPLICLLAAVCFIGYLGFTKRLGLTKTDAAKVAAAVPDEGSGPDAEALALVRKWRMAGDDNTLFERLGSVVEHPGGWRAWSAEKTDEDAYLVLFREVAGTPVYAFEVDLKSRSVQPSPETVDRLTMMRVRDEATRKLKSLPGSNN